VLTLVLDELRSLHDHAIPELLGELGR
jgi:hypothetical protein